MSGLQETFDGRVEFIVLDIDDSGADGTRSQLGITAQAQYLLVDSAGQIVRRWFGVINEGQIASEIEGLLQS
ncbi:MAG: hypothetical protein F4X02_02565 [Chloroflexi bacterium]|nr:hypothetical protein [Chloroflexota bacterium]